MSEIKQFLGWNHSKAPDGIPTGGRSEKEVVQMPEQQNVSPTQSPEESSELESHASDVLDVSDVPLPPTEVKKTVQDEIGKPVAFKWAVLGSGQGGGRLAHQFWKMGYRRVAAINTAPADLKPLNLPEANKLLIGAQAQADSERKGAGARPEEGAEAVRYSREDVHDLIRRCFGTDFSRILITVTGGGGTGSGSVCELVDICGELMDKLELREYGKDPKVGVVVALPRESDGKQAHANAYRTFNQLYELVPHKVSPLIVIDNQRISKLYPDLSVNDFWERANHSICSIFHLLNVVSARHSEYTSFDPGDFETILQSGLLVFGAMPVAKWDAREDVSVAIRDNLNRNVLVGGLDLTTGTVAGCVMVANKDILGQITQDALDDGFSMLGRMLKHGSAVHRGIYAGNSPSPVVYTMIGGLAAPIERMRVLKRIGCVPAQPTVEKE